MPRKFSLFVYLLSALIASVYGVGVRAHAQPAIVLNISFEFIRQGQVGVITVSGPSLAGGVVSALDRSYPFFPTADGFAALVAVPYNQRIRRDYSMRITLYQTDGASIHTDSTLRVESGEFIREPDFAIPTSRFYLLDPTVQANEDIRMISIYSAITPEGYWEGQFAMPLSGQATSPFGSVRDFNDGSTRRHLGHDFGVPSGVTVAASASGRVVFARSLDIRGNTVVIDHGWGVFSSYSHLSALFVVPGQFALQGEVIGVSGNTGRSTGPHLHWEIAVNGTWVSPLEFLRLKLPTPRPAY